MAETAQALESDRTEFHPSLTTYEMSLNLNGPQMPQLQDKNYTNLPGLR